MKTVTYHIVSIIGCLVSIAIIYWLGYLVIEIKKFGPDMAVLGPISALLISLIGTVPIGQGFLVYSSIQLSKNKSIINFVYLVPNAIQGLFHLFLIIYITYIFLQSTPK